MNDKLAFYMSELPRELLRGHPDFCAILIAAMVVPSFIGIMIIMQNEGNREKVENLKEKLFIKINWIK